MKTSRWLLLGLILIGSFSIASCKSGVGPEIDNGSGTIRIVSLSPAGPYIAGTIYNFTVQVAYTLENTDDAQIVAGFGRRKPDGTSSIIHSAEEIVAPTTMEGLKTYTFSNYLNDAAPNEDIFMVFLNPYPVYGAFTPFDTVYQVITVTP